MAETENNVNKKSCTSNPKAEAICINEAFHVDLLQVILERLPCRFAGRYRSVCKLWHSLIPNPNHRPGLIHRQRTSKVDVRVVVSISCLWDQAVITCNFPDSLKGSDLLGFEQAGAAPPGCIVGWSGGMLLCSTGKFNQTHYYICNPVTKQWAALPPPPRTHPCVHLGFICDNNDDNWPPASFKVVRVPLLSYSNKKKLLSDLYFQVEVYSSETNEWRDDIWVSTAPKEIRWSQPSRVVVYNGCLCFHPGGGRVVAYDPYNNKVRAVFEPPKEAEPRGCGLELVGLCCGALWIAQYPASSHLRMWQLQLDCDIYQMMGTGDDQYRWVLKHHVYLDGISETVMKRTGRLLWLVGVLSMHPHDPDIVLLRCTIDNNDFVVSFNFKTMMILTLAPCPSGAYLPRDAFTLVLP